MNNNDNFSTRLNALRISKGLKQKDVASSVGVTSATYNRYEKGLSNPKANTILKLADFFQVSPNYLIFGSVESQSDTTQSMNNFRLEPVRTIIKLLEYNHIGYELIESDRPEDIQIKITMPITKESAILNYLDIANINTQTMYYFLRALDNKIKEYQEKNKN